MVAGCGKTIRQGSPRQKLHGSFGRDAEIARHVQVSVTFYASYCITLRSVK